MDELLTLIERVKNAILFGENDFCEFKSALEGKPESKKPRLTKKICDDIAEALVAFANTDGGEIYIGVEDDGTITGVPHADEDIILMLKAIESHVLEGQLLPIVNSRKVLVDNKFVLFFQVMKGTTEIFQLRDGRVMVRKDKRTVPANIKRIEFERLEIISREYDRQYIDGLTIHDLDVSLIDELADKYLTGMTAARYLQQMGLATYSSSGLRFTRASALLFAKEINKWHPRSQVRFLKIDGDELLAGERYNVVSDEIVHGNIFELANKAWEGLRPFLAYKTEFGGGKFEQKYSYPEEACRETLLNALVHRDYNSHNGIEVRIFNDRLEVKSPGALLSTLTIEDLYALDNRHESRNTKIAYVLKITTFIRELGEGLKRIFTLMEDSERKKPELYSNTNWFTVTLFNKVHYSPSEQEFINLFDSVFLSKNQRKIIVLGIDGSEISPADIYKAMNSTELLTYNNEVTGLRQFGVLDEFRTNSQANAFAKRSGIPKDKVTRFKIKVPSATQSAIEPVFKGRYRGQRPTNPLTRTSLERSSESKKFVVKKKYK